MLNSRIISKRLIISGLFLLSCGALLAQSQQDRIRPHWLRTEPKALNSTYTFKTFRIQASGLSEAKRKLPDEAAYYMERSYSVSGITIEATDVSTVYGNDNTKSLTIETITDTVITEAHKINLSLRIIDEYIDKENYYFLCALPNPHVDKVIYNQMKRTAQYGARGLWQSAIVPGWGQMHKGSYLKGGLIMGGAVALIGGSVAMGLTRNDYLAKRANTHSASVKQQYTVKANNMATGMYCCIGSLAALYVYNLIDAVVAPGGKRVIVYPAVTPNGSIGVGGSLKF